ncbi:4a-hydroxytetrahydrobiopterin dehydratase [Candidatus Nanosalina sp. VS9-1]|uniref:4a-hydroxytetrahydrobiopterin dehydratase n=1 Tax=Candidatus Nanosalina sp. VS9-1 TaxID=3388566 RepID=UPI0039E15021
MAELIEDEELEQALDELQIWSELNGKLTTRVEFDDYRETVFFANTVFSLAEEEFHHPEVSVQYGAVEIDLWSHEEDGITEKDLEMAKKIEEKVGKINWD